MAVARTRARDRGERALEVLSPSCIKIGVEPLFQNETGDSTPLYIYIYI